MLVITAPLMYWTSLLFLLTDTFNQAVGSRLTPPTMLQLTVVLMLIASLTETFPASSLRYSHYTQGTVTHVN